MVAQDLLATANSKTAVLLRSGDRANSSRGQVQTFSTFSTRGRTAHWCGPTIGQKEKKEQENQGTQQICFD